MNDDIFDQTIERVNEIQDRLQEPEELTLAQGEELYREAKDLIAGLRERLEPSGATFTVIRDDEMIEEDLE